eukprot:2765415-Ditylum_brightwellii.AAC.1
MRAKLDGEEDTKEAATESDYQIYSYQVVHPAIHALYMTSQKEGMMLERYLNELLNCCDMLEQYRSSAASHTGLTMLRFKTKQDLEWEDTNPEEKEHAKMKFIFLLRKLTNACLH